MLSLQIFLILLFSKIDGFEYLLNIPFSIIFIPIHISLLCFPIGLSITIFFEVFSSSKLLASIGYAGGSGLLLFLILSMVHISVLLIGFVLDSFILQSVFPFIAVLGSILGMVLVVVCVVLSIVGVVFLVLCLMNNGNH